MGFAEDIKAWSDSVIEAANTNTNEAVSTYFNQVVALSPDPPGMAGYATGNLKDQWYTSSGVGAYSSEVGSSKASGGQSSLTRIGALVSEDLFYGRDNSVALTNNTEQAYYAEVTGWPKGAGTNGWIWKGAAPYRMVDLSIQYTLNQFDK